MIEQLRLVRIKFSDVISLLLLSKVVAVITIISYLFSKEEDDFSFYSGFIFLIAGVFVTRIAKQYRLINNFSSWINCLSLYVIVSYVVFLWFWYIPLYHLGDLRTPTQMAAYQDANYYDYLAALAAKSPFSEWPSIINATWLSQGVVSYLGIVYKVFGTSQFNYFFINALLGYLSVLFLQGIVSSSGRDVGLLLLFVPYTLYYNITPGKEVLTNVVSYSILYFYFVLRVSTKSSVFIGYSLIIILIIILGLIRFNALIMVVLVVALYSLLHAKNRFKILFKFGFLGIILLSLLYAIGAENLFYLIIDMDTHVKMLDVRLQDVEPSSLKYILATSLTSNNFLINIILSPIRAIVWLLAPFPFLNILDLGYSVIFDENYAIFRSGEALVRSLSSLGMVFFVFNIFVKIRFLKLIYVDNSQNFILFSALTLTFILSTTNFIEGARYRTIVEPLAFCWLIYSLGKRNNNLNS